MPWQTLWDLTVVFMQASLLALGGGTAVLGAIQRSSVDTYHWLTGKQFVDVFAITQATPGPSMLIVGLIGYWSMAKQFPTDPWVGFAAGLLGMLVATTAMFLPACLLAYYVGSWWEHFHSSSWRVPVEKGLSAVTVGLLFASAVIVSQDATAHRALPKRFEAVAIAPRAETTTASSGATVRIISNSDINWRPWLIIALSAVLFAFTKINPLVLMAVAGAMGYMKLI